MKKVYRVKDGPRKDEVVEADDLGLCPCGQAISGSKEAMAVLHELPTCAAYNDLDPLEFISYVRRSRGISDAQVEALAKKC